MNNLKYILLALLLSMECLSSCHSTGSPQGGQYDEITRNNVVGEWRIDFGGVLGFANIRLYFSTVQVDFILERKTVNETLFDPVNIRMTNNGWEITLKNKWDAYYLLDKKGNLTMKFKGYPEESSHCLVDFKPSVIENNIQILEE